MFALVCGGEKQDDPILSTETRLELLANARVRERRRAVGSGLNVIIVV